MRYAINSELFHSGVKGMKWGVRRYQNKDGTLTPEGKKRYDRDSAANAKKKKDNRIPEEGINDPNRWVREDRERSRRVLDSGRQMTNDLTKAVDIADKRAKRNRPKMDLSEMSDVEMRAQINRALLEKQYNDVFNPPNVSRGIEVARDVLETAGTVLAIGSSALGIALAIRDLRGG